MTKFLNKTYFASWLIGALIMFICSYCWHHLFLNDFERILLPDPLFYSLLGVAYLGVSFIILVIYGTGKVKLGPHLSGIVIGILTGVFIYLIALTLGFSFNNSRALKQSLFDLAWQVVEQGIGGFCIAVSYQIFDKGGFFVRI